MTIAEYAVIGGGVVGMSLAYGLARQGKQVQVLDEGDVAIRASRGNFALVWLQSKGLGMPDYARWSRRSCTLWPDFARELAEVTGLDVSLDQRGGFLLYLDDSHLEARARQVDKLQASLGADSFPIDVMGHNAVRQMLPEIGPDVVGGTFCPLDGHVNALRLFNALHQACRARGVDYRPNCPVTAATWRDGLFHLTCTSGQTFRAERLVLAAGLGSVRLAPMLGLDAPLRPERGQIMVTEKVEPFLPYPTGTIRQTDEGGIMIGASKEDAGYDTGTRASVSTQLAQDAVRMFPRLASARIVRSWSALRVMSPDEYPIYQQSRSVPGAFLVTCHSGVTLAAAHALDLAPVIASGTLPGRFNVFSPERFNHVPAA